MKVLCFGSLNIDYTYKVDHFVKKGETLSSECLQVFSGGKGLNQSIALAKAGVETWHAGSIGVDGRFLLKHMETAGVNTECVSILEDIRSGNAIIQNDKEGDNCIILYGGANQAITRTQADVVLSRCQEGDFIVLQNEISELDYIIEKAHKNGLKIVLNPSPMNEKVRELPLEYVDYFVLNEIEAEQLLGRNFKEDYDKEELGRMLSDRFPNATIVLTLGKEGAIYLDQGEILLQPAYEVKVVDTTAAGDTFTGYFISGIIKGLSIQEVMDMASKAAAIAVTRQGASPSIPLLEEVESVRFS